MNRLTAATALALALGMTAPALAQTSDEARGGEAMAQSKTAPGGQAGTSAAGEAWYGRFSAEELIGKNVVNEKGEEIGDIEDVVIDPTDRSMYAVLSVGGVLGFGDQNIAMPFDQLRLGAGDAILMSEQSKEELKELPAYDEERYEQAPRGQPLGQSGK